MKAPGPSGPLVIRSEMGNLPVSDFLSNRTSISYLVAHNGIK